MALMRIATGSEHSESNLSSV